MKNCLPPCPRSILAILWLSVLAVPTFVFAVSQDEFYAQLAKTPALARGFSAKRTPTGLDFNSEEQIQVNGKAHPRFCFEIEGPLDPPPEVKTLQQTIDFLANFIVPDVDAAHEEKDSIKPGLGSVIVDVNGTNVCFMQFKSTKAPDTFVRRAIIYRQGQIFSIMMCLHSVPENDPHGLLLFGLMIDFVRLLDAPAPAEGSSSKPAAK